MAADLSMPVRVIRYGIDEPLLERRLLRAGPITAVVEGSNLRYVRVGDVEIVRGIYVAVRNRNWDTPPPHFLTYHVDQDTNGFVVRFRAEHTEHGVNFVWDGTISGSADGVVSYEMDGEVRETFWRGRIGICLLHPMSLAGAETDVLSGVEWVRGRFPVKISPHQPFTDMREMRYEVGQGILVDTKFEGDLFEMEDHRNWTDASYKTYSTPLRIPYPVEVKAGGRVWQKVTITVKGATGEAWQPGRQPEARIAARRVAMLPGIGLGTSTGGRPLQQKQVEALRALNLDHLWHEVKLLDIGWEEELRQAAGEATALGVELEVAALTDSSGSNLERLVQVITGGQAPAARLTVFDRENKYVTTPALAERTRALLSEAKASVEFGGGSIAFFTEFNRADLPKDLLDFAAWALNPQVHAFDNGSLVETLQAQAETVRSGKAIVGDLPIRVGPVTLKMQVNPNATGPEVAPGPGELPSGVDVRQMSLFAAVWTVGSIRYLASQGVAGLTYFETAGMRGIMDNPAGERNPKFRSLHGAVYPVYHVLADVGEFARGEILEVGTSDPLTVDLLALGSGDRLRVLVANMTDQQQHVVLRLPPVRQAGCRILDETTAIQAMTEPVTFRQRVDLRLDETVDRVELDLLPYGLARLDGSLTG